MSGTSNDPNANESTLGGGASAKWETVGSPGNAMVPSAPQPMPAPPFLPNIGYGNLGQYAGTPGYGLPANQPPAGQAPPPANSGGYQQVYGGSPAPGQAGAAASAGAPNSAYGAPVYGAQPTGYPPPAGYGGAPPLYGQQGFSQQGNYGANVAELLAVGALMTGARRQRRFVRHLIVWPLIIFGSVAFLLVRGCFRLI